MNKPVRETMSIASGWLIAQARDVCLFFIRDPKSIMVAPNVFTQLWYCNDEGVPTKLKNTRRLDHESSCETWHELIINGCKLVEHQFNAFVDSA